jgi:hypothetical protein
LRAIRRREDGEEKRRSRRETREGVSEPDEGVASEWGW